MQENSPKKITIPDSVKTIERHAFSYCTSLEEVIIPEGVETIGRGAFGGCESLRQIDVDINNGEYKSKDGNLYSKDGKVLIRYAPGKLEESFKILPCVETIGEDAFRDCESLKNIIIPGSENGNQLGGSFSGIIPQELAEIPSSYYSEADEQGTLVELYTILTNLFRMKSGHSRSISAPSSIFPTDIRMKTSTTLCI